MSPSLTSRPKLNAAAYAFLLISLVQSFLNISLDARLIHRLLSLPDAESAHIMYNSGLIAIQAVALLLVAVTLYARSQALAIAATVVDLLLIILQAAQLAQTGVEALQAAGVSTLVLGSAAKLLLAWRCLHFGRHVPRIIDTDNLRARRIILFQQLLLSLVIVAACVFLQMCLQLASSGAQMQCIVALFICVSTLGLCLFAAAYELWSLMNSCVVIFVIVAPAYFIYKLVTVNQVLFIPSDAGRHYLTVLLAMLLVLDVMLIIASLLVAHTFDTSRCEHVRRFRTLTQSEGDPGTLINNISYIAKSEPASHGFSDMMNSTKRSLKESLLRAFFSGLSVPTDMHVEQKHASHTLKLKVPPMPEPVSPRQPPAAVCSPTNSTLSDQSIPEIPSVSERMSHASEQHGFASPAPAMLMRRLPMPRISALVLSIEELNMHSSNWSPSTNHPLSHEITGAVTSPAASWSLVSSISIRDSTSTAGIKSPVRTIPSPSKPNHGSSAAAAAAAAAVADTSNSREDPYKARRACYSLDGVSIAHGTMRSILSTATSADDNSVGIGSCSRATILNEGFDP
ncbi:hypothetical protein LPJ79_002832 [Coemansia sp. RSA 1821]|nr:hypothetical protein LPJ68_003976 [Coemansia sp. RSA 1086]KAJ1750491.1 hypothetical protein LPJ79_002832 [Coemansia sp. RSA 1821]